MRFAFRYGYVVFAVYWYICNLRYRSETENEKKKRNSTHGPGVYLAASTGTPGREGFDSVAAGQTMREHGTGR